MKKILVWIVFAMVFAGFVYAEGEVISISLLDQDPDPAGAGVIAKLRFSVANIGDDVLNDVEVELIPKYPFKKISGEEYVKTIPVLSGYPYTAKYQVLVDKEALEATNEIDIRYRTSSGEAWSRKTFELDVDDVQTDFDLVIQEISGNEVSIAIANVGKNVAYSLILRVPEQEYFETIGTSGQMIGNLEDGDYTLVTYQIAKKGRQIGEMPLKFQMDYTDNIGERRTVIKEVPFEAGGTASAIPQPGTSEFEAMRARRLQQTQPKYYQQWWFWAIIIAAVFIGWKAYKKYKGRKKK